MGSPVAGAGADGERPEREGVVCVEVPQNDQRIVPASERLYAAIVERWLTLPDDPEFARGPRRECDDEALAPRGRISKPDGRTHVHGVIALSMAVERAEFKPERVELLGWI